jgi:threonine dehydratase
MTPPRIDPDAIRAAAEAIRGAVEATPLVHSRTLSGITGAQVWLKLENLQFTGSFKDRGALNKLLTLGPAERRSGVIACSAGNHAQGVAYHAHRLGIAATIVMPRFTPNTKVEQTRGFGAQIVLAGASLEESREVADRLARERDLVFVHPYDDPAIICGQGTVALEMLEAQPDLDALLIPVGGGGLAAGCAVAARALRPQIEIFGVETELYPGLQQALAGEPIECGGATIADGIAVKAPGRLTLPILRELLTDALVVGEGQLERAVLLLLEVEKTVVEGAGAAGLAALLAFPERFRGRRVGVVVSGGNIDLLILSSIIQRGLVRTQRLVLLRIEIRDLPGALAELTHEIGSAGGSIISVSHQRAFTDAPLRSADVEFVLEARGAEHAEQIMAALREAGYEPRT